MTPPVKALGLTLLILALVAGIWGAGYFWDQANQPASKETSQLKKQQEGTVQAGTPLAIEQSSKNSTTTLDTASEKATTTSSVLSDLKEGDLLANPFKLSGTLSGLTDAAWQLQDPHGGLLAQGLVHATDTRGGFEAYGWYDQRPTGKQGLLVFIDPTSPSNIPLKSLKVALQTKTQNVEIYMGKGPIDGQDCTAVSPIKRTIVSTGGDKMNYYEAALRSLVAGPTEQEQQTGWRSALPMTARVIRVGQAEKGEYIGDFSEDLIKGISDACRLATIKAQITKTLTTVYVPGRSLPGRVFVEGQAADF